jgi:hypothetical protein
LEQELETSKCIHVWKKARYAASYCWNKGTAEWIGRREE